MFPKLSDMINYLFGSHIDLPVQTYGFFLAMAFLVAGYILSLELKRKENEGLLPERIRKYNPNQTTEWPEIFLGTALSAVFGWKLIGIIIQYHDFAANPQQYLLSGKGSLSAMVIIALVSISYHIYRKKAGKSTTRELQEEIVHPYQYTWNILMVAMVFAVIGSKLFDIFDNFGSFLQNPVHSLLSFRGLTFYGGFIVTVIALLLYMRVIKLDWKHVIDCSAPAIMIGYAVGRLGCHFSGDGCWGVVNSMAQPSWLDWIPNWLWAYDFPHNVINHGVPIPGCHGPNCMVLNQPVFPTSLYESLIALVSFGVLWFFRFRIKAPVVLFGLFLILNGFSRFFIEKIRVNNKYDLLGLHLSQAEIISSCLLVAGIAVIIYFSKRHRDSKLEKL